MSEIRITKIDGQEFIPYKDYLILKEQIQELVPYNDYLRLKEEKQELEYLWDINEELKEENKKLKEEIKEIEKSQEYRYYRCMKAEKEIQDMKELKF